MRRFFSAVLFAVCVSVHSPASTPLIVRSPDSRVSISFRLDTTGAPCWSVSYRDHGLLGWSPLGLQLKDGNDLMYGFVVRDTLTVEHDEEYTLTIGKTKQARDHYRALEVLLEERSRLRRTLSLQFRAYDDGAAFRYVLPAQDSLSSFEIVQEETGFNFPADLKAWAFQINAFYHSFEGAYLPTTVDAIPDTGEVYLPLTMQGPDGVTLSITEADLTDYAGMYLRGLPGPSLRTVLAPWRDGSGVCVRGSTPFRSPWRVLMIGDSPGRLIESTIILNLNAPCRLSDVSWIRPGKAIFPWWPNFFSDKPGVPGRLSFENQKYYIDFAAENGIRYLELEPPWYGDTDDCIAHPEKYDITRPVPELRLPELFAYARVKGMGIFLWTHWRNVDMQADSAFPMFARWGAAGVKIDFMNRDDQEMVRWYHKVLKKAAEHRLMVFFHGAYKPTGTQRTFPHLLTQEGVMGNEQNKVIRAITPQHTVTLPFTRMLAGPMDFTPGGFRAVTVEEFAPDWDRPRVMGTRCRQLAMFVVYESPLAMVCDDPSAYRDQPGLEFIRMVPTSWDETRVIDGRIGEFIVVARRSGNEWYLGAMTNESAKLIDLPLTFLGKGQYVADIFEDGRDADVQPVDVSIARKTLRSDDTLSVRLARGGGLAVRFVGQ
ncbi:MAG: glycoside hydrolase family 97 protein [Bacteroidota bacterium]